MLVMPSPNMSTATRLRKRQFWNNAIMRVKICGRKSDGMAAAISTDDHALDTIRPAEHTPSKIDVAVSSKSGSLTN
jgi:hypothetical protein